MVSKTALSNNHSNEQANTYEQEQEHVSFLP